MTSPRVPTAGERLKAWRTERRLTQREVAAWIGVSQAAWCDWEQDKKVPLTSAALDIARISDGICPVEIFGVGNGPYQIAHHVWLSMRARCLHANHPSYRLYGGRGIYICERWMTFAGFYQDMGPRPGKNVWFKAAKYSIDRIDNDGGYTCGKCSDCQMRGAPTNCRWTTQAVQARNHRCGRCQSCREGGNTKACASFRTRCLKEIVRKKARPAAVADRARTRLEG